MRQTLLSLLAIFVAVGTMMLGSGLLGTFLSLRMVMAHFSNALIGVAMAAFYGGMVLGFFICPRIVRSVGHIRAFTAFAAIATVAILLHAMYIQPVFWIILRLLNGLSMMGLYMVVESWLNERAAREVRGRVFSVYQAVGFLGLGLGQLLLNLGDIHSDLLFMVAAMLFALCLVPVALTRAAHPRPVEPIQFDVMHLIRQAPFGLLGCLGAGLVNGAFYGLAAVYSRRLGLDVAGVSLFMGTTILSGLVLQWPVGHLSDRYDRRSVLALLSIGVSLVSLLIMLSGVGLVALLLGAAVFGGLAFTIYPVSVAHANDHIEADEVVPATATLILAYSIGASLGPLGGAVAMWRAGPSGLWVFTASVSLVLGLLVYLRRGADTVTVEEQGEFVAMPRTSAVIAELDPRAEPAIEGAAAAAGEADPAATPEAGDPSGRSAP